MLSAPVLLCRLLQRFRWQLIGSKHRTDLDCRTQPEKEGFGDNRKFGGVVEVDDEVSTSGPFDGPKVRCFGLKFVDYSLKGLPETSILDSRVSLIHGDTEREHKAHTFLLSLSRGAREPLFLGHKASPKRSSKSSP